MTVSPAQVSDEPAPARWRAGLADYLSLTKPRIALLVLVTEYTGIWLAFGGRPPLSLLVPALLGTGLASMSSGVLNNVVDRNIDAVMARTAGRPLAARRVSERSALAFGLVLALVSGAILALAVNLLAAYLALATIAFYVLIYTVWLKRATPMCTSIGGLAGALPPVIGWAAVQGSVASPVPWFLFALLFLWQPAHFWALAIVRKEEYRAAHIPMLPVVKGDAVTQRHMFWWTVITVSFALGAQPLGLTGQYYTVVAAIMGVYYMALTVRFVTRPVDNGRARQLFFVSILYLFVVFTMLFVDGKVNGGL